MKFAGNYHGHADSLLVRAGSGSLTLGVPTSPGVPPSVVESTMVVAYNDVDGLVACFDQSGPEIAAVIVEPVAANMGVIPPGPSFLQCIRELTESAGSVFIADEVITGFRVGPAGAQGVMDFSPDLAILGKIIGGGLPVGAYAGRREVMSRVAPEGPVYQAGTLSGNPLAMAAGIANLAPLREPAFYETLDTATHQLAQGLRGAADRAGVPVTVNTATGMLTVFFSASPVETLADAERCDTAAYARFFHAMLDRGVYLPPSQFEAWMISSQHTESINQRAIQCASEAFAAM
ncbi:MAG: glutamate-1-semialdehyde 2,1-aminomutase [Chloroflexota bacterium]